MPIRKRITMKGPPVDDQLDGWCRRIYSARKGGGASWQKEWAGFADYCLKNNLNATRVFAERVHSAVPMVIR